MPKKSSKSWDKIAPQFSEWTRKDDYPQKLLEKIKLEKEDTVLDIGCGNGVITLPIAQKVKNVTGMDISRKMLDLLEESAKEKGLTNIDLIKNRLENMVIGKDLESYDVVVASRSLNGVRDIGKEFEKINEIARKYVYITLWGVSNREFEHEASKIMGRDFNQRPDYIYAYNILHELGIYANVEMLECNSHSYYSNIDEAMDRLRWRIGNLNEEEETILMNYLAEKMVKTEDSKLKLPYSKPDWVLIWWKKKQ